MTLKYANSRNTHSDSRQPLTFEQIIAIYGAKKQGQSHKAHCPSHADKKASLEISLKDNKILLRCHAGCDTKDVLANKNLEFRGSDIMDKETQGHNSLADETKRSPWQWNGCKPKPDHFYPYHDSDGKLIFQVIRLDKEHAPTVSNHGH
jgi:hypothetical protein